MNTYSDEYIDYWGKVFCDAKLHQKGVTFQRFLMMPSNILEATETDDLMQSNNDFLPLLRAQQRVQDKLDGELIEQHMTEQFERSGHVMEMHGDCNIEPMHKRAGNKLWKTGLGVNH